MPQLSPEKLLDVYSLGRCTNIIDIFCENELLKARDAYVEKYSPPPDTPSGCSYNAIATKVMDLFPYFHHVLYERE